VAVHRRSCSTSLASGSLRAPSGRLWLGLARRLRSPVQRLEHLREAQLEDRLEFGMREHVEGVLADPAQCAPTDLERIHARGHVVVASVANRTYVRNDRSNRATSACAPELARRSVLHVSSEPTRLRVVSRAPSDETGEMGSTKVRLLDAAEQLFSERGYAGTSLRAVTRSAGVSVSAANYHFGSKQALLQAIVERRVQPVNARRAEEIAALEASAGGEPVSVEAIVEAFVRPLFDAWRGSDEAWAHYRHVAARLFSDPPEVVGPLRRQLFEPISRRFVDALARALPGRDSEDLRQAFQFTVGVMVHAIGGHLLETAEHDAAGLPPRPDEPMLERMVAYCAAGLRAERRPAGDPS
jgi:AcrR family transcriptional regulator